MVVPKRHHIPGHVVLLTSLAADKPTFSVLVRTHLFLNTALLDLLISSSPPLLLPSLQLCTDLARLLA